MGSALSWRTRYGFGWLEAAVMAAYCCVLALVIPHHELWSDEAQAWLMARENTAWQLFAHRMHYEGAPPLWHFLLRIFHLAHGTYAGMPWFGAAFAVAGIYVFLRWSPFPAIVRVLLPFTYFLAYQYAVIARSYNLFPLLVFTLCALYRRKEKVVWFAFVAGLLANLSLQGIEFASVLSALYIFDLYRERDLRSPVARRKLISAAVLYAAMAAAACYSAIPAPDVNFAVSGSVSDGIVHRVLVRMVGETRPIHSLPPLPGPALPPVAQPPRPHLLSDPAGWAAWHIDHSGVDANGRPLPQSSLGAAAEFIVSMASEATWPIATSNLVACIFLCLVVAWLYKHRGLRFLLPWLALLLVGQIIWVSDHHVGMVLVSLIAGIWLAAQDNPFHYATRRLDTAFKSAMTAILALQVVWTVVSARNDIYSPYDPGRETAEFMHRNPVARTAALNYWSTSIQPYFKDNPFFNIPTRYRIWSFNANPDPYYQETLAQHPDRVVYSAEFPGPGLMRNQWVTFSHIPTPEEIRTLPWDQAVYYFQRHGYVETHRFCGKRFSRNSSSYMDCDLIFEPVKSAETHASGKPVSPANAD